jgi:arylsulfatase A-like enzyme
MLAFSQKRRSPATSLLILGLASLQGCASTQPVQEVATSDHSSRPNILLIVADDLGWGDVGYHGSDIMTPYIDQLAVSGVVFEQHYVTPTCSPTRACLLSGRYSSRFGVLTPTNRQAFPSGYPTLAVVLQRAGYRTVLSGKWHLGSRSQWGPNLFGFGHAYGSLAGGVTPFGHSYKKGDYAETWHRNGELIEETGHVTDLIGEEAVQQIELAAKDDRPFFIYVPFTAVHIPILEPAEWTRRYEGRIESESYRRYAACATHMDAMIGRMIEALDRTDQRDDTLIIFFSDNGSAQRWRPVGNFPNEDPAMTSPVLGSNLPLRGWKGWLYEGGIRVPALVNWPGVLQPGKITVPVHAVDWMPTLCALIQTPETPKEDWDGVNIWPLLSGEAKRRPDRSLYWRTTDQTAIRIGRWKLILTDNRPELFNLRTDPYETTNLATERPERVVELKRELERQRGFDAKEIVPFL